MKLIKLELAEFNERCEPVSAGSETYVREDCLFRVCKEIKKTSEIHRRVFYVAYLTDGQSFNITEKCYNGIIGKEKEIPEGLEIKPTVDRSGRSKYNSKRFAR